MTDPLGNVFELSRAKANAKNKPDISEYNRAREFEQKHGAALRFNRTRKKWCLLADSHWREEATDRAFYYAAEISVATREQK